MTPLQTEFPLAVAVCAWCKPRKGAARAAALSHGICLRHLREMKLAVQGFYGGGAARGTRQRGQGEPTASAQVMTLPLR